MRHFKLVLVSDNSESLEIRDTTTGKGLFLRRDEIPLLIGLLRIGHQKSSIGEIVHLDDDNMDADYVCYDPIPCDGKVDKYIRDNFRFAVAAHLDGTVSLSFPDSDKFYTVELSAALATHLALTIIQSVNRSM